MSEQLQELEEALNRAPEDWSARLRLIEARIRNDDMEGARRLVRESPDEFPLPPELQYRLHTLLTQGKAALGEDGETEESEDLPKPESESESVEPESSVLPPDPAEMVPTRSLPEEKSSPRRKIEKPEGWVPEVVPAKRTAPEKLETEPNTKEPPLPEVMVRRPSVEASRTRWDDYEGDLHLEPMETVSRHSRSENSAQKVSALTAALAFHLIVLFLLGFVVIAMPRPKPPQLIATVQMPKKAEPVVNATLQKLTEQKPASASAATPNVIGAAGISAVRIPEMENTNALDVTTMVTGMANVGDGFSFSGDSREMSEVNFFGISSGGKRIVFIVDATREMLVDEKGGMYAYDKVKSEVAAMMAGLNRRTRFNLLLVEGRRMMAFADEPVEGVPSNLRKAIEWLDPLNRTYEELGLARHEGELLSVEKDLEPIAARDVAHYTMAIQKALEWQAESIFCISSGYRRLMQSPTPEEMEKWREAMAANPGTPGEVSPAERKAWNDAMQRTRDWLQKENAARSEQGLAPKVVLDFNRLVQEITGATPPRPTGGVPGAPRPTSEPHSTDDIETLVKNGVSEYYRGVGLDPPSLHMVVFLGEDEDMNDETRDHFKNLTRKNNGKFKMLRGLAALENVTGK